MNFIVQSISVKVTSLSNTTSVKIIS